MWTLNSSVILKCHAEPSKGSPEQCHPELVSEPPAPIFNPFCKKWNFLLIFD
jgi:hypothetical protein